MSGKCYVLDMSEADTNTLTVWREMEAWELKQACNQYIFLYIQARCNTPAFVLDSHTPSPLPSRCRLAVINALSLSIESSKLAQIYSKLIFEHSKRHGIFQCYSSASPTRPRWVRIMLLICLRYSFWHLYLPGILQWRIDRSSYSVVSTLVSCLILWSAVLTTRRNWGQIEGPSPGMRFHASRTCITPRLQAWVEASPGQDWGWREMVHKHHASDIVT